MCSAKDYPESHQRNQRQSLSEEDRRNKDANVDYNVVVLNYFLLN